MSLLYRFGVKPNTENIVSFDYNDLLKGTEFMKKFTIKFMIKFTINILI